MKRSERYRQMAQDVAAFRDAYQAVMTHMEPVREYLSSEIFRYDVKEGQKEEAARSSRKAAQLAGKAKYAESQSGLSLNPPVSKTGVTLDAIGAWDHSLRDARAMPPDHLINMYDLLIGALEDKAERAAAADNTWAGRLAAFVGFPARVRSIVAEDHPGFGKAALAAGVFAQITVGVVVTLLGAAATAGVTALWKNVVHSSPAPAKSRQPVTPATTAPAPTPSAPTPTRT
jgi:hypothetical protein